MWQNETFCKPVCLHALTRVLPAPVPAQPSSFEAEAELDTRISLTWLWPVQDQITKYELQYWEAGSDSKVSIRTRRSDRFMSKLSLLHSSSPYRSLRLLLNLSRFPQWNCRRLLLFMMQPLWVGRLCYCSNVVGSPADEKNLVWTQSALLLSSAVAVCWNSGGPNQLEAGGQLVFGTSCFCSLWQSCMTVCSAVEDCIICYCRAHELTRAAPLIVVFFFLLFFSPETRDVRPSGLPLCGWFKAWHHVLFLPGSPLWNRFGCLHPAHPSPHCSVQ